LFDASQNGRSRIAVLADFAAAVANVITLNIRKIKFAN
jgi:hypothetical protein